MNKQSASKLAPPKLAQLFEGERIALKNEGRYFSTLSDHQGEKGRLNESHLKNFLRKHLPEKYGIGTGFIVSNNTINNTNNPQIDIIIYDRLNNAPLYQSEAFGVYQVEIVYGYIEVKTTFTNRELKKALSVNARIRELAAHKVYIDVNNSAIPPRFYLFAYNSKPSKSIDIEKYIESAFEAQGAAHAHGIYLLDKNLLVARKALYDPSRVELYKREGELAFAEFVINIIRHLETMIPRREIAPALRLPVSTGLPLADTERYLKIDRS